MSKVNVMDLTIKDLVAKEGKLSVHYHGCGDLQTAYNKLKPYTSLGSIKKGSSVRGTTWLKIDSNDVSFTAFL